MIARTNSLVAACLALWLFAPHTLASSTLPIGQPALDEDARGYSREYPAGIPVDPADYASAKARAAASKAEFRRAQSFLFGLGDQIRRNFETSSEYTTAQLELRKAWEALDAARRSAISGIKDNPRYVEVTRSRDKLARVLAAGGLSEKDRIVTAERKMDLSAAITRMEFEAFQKSDAVQSAHQRLTQAADKLATLRSDFRDAATNNTRWQSARQARDAALVQQVAAAAYLDGLQEAYNVTLRAYYYRTYWQRYYPVSYAGYAYPGRGYGYGGYYNYP